MFFSTLPIALTTLHLISSAAALPASDLTTRQSIPGFKLVVPGGRQLASNYSGDIPTAIQGGAGGTIYQLRGSTIAHPYDKYFHWIVKDPPTGHDAVYDSAIGGPQGRDVKCTIADPARQRGQLSCVGGFALNQTVLQLCDDKLYISTSERGYPCAKIDLQAVAP